VQNRPREDQVLRRTGARLNPAAEPFDPGVSVLFPVIAPSSDPAPVSSAESWQWVAQKLEFFQRGRALQRARDAQAKMFEDAHVYFPTSKSGLGPGPGPGPAPGPAPDNGHCSHASATVINMELSRPGKKALNVESPSFTPLTLQQAAKKSTFSSQAASAAPFTPRGPSTTSEWNCYG
jgi:hypothetical protein